MISPSRCALAVIAVLFLGSSSPAAAADATPESVSVPLHVIRIDRDTIKVGIEVGLGGGKPKLYEFDTGASGFYAAYDASWWPSFDPLPDAPITQTYGSGVEYVAQKVKTAVAIPSDHGDLVAEIEVARITEAFGGPLGPEGQSTWKHDLERDDAPLYGHFFGDFGGDLRKKDGLASVLPQLPGNLSSGFIVELGCDRRVGPRLVIGLTGASRARFTTRVAMQPGNGDTFPISGLPTYSQKLIVADFLLSRGGTVQTFTSDALLDTGAPTTTVQESDDLRIDRALVDTGRDVVKPATYVSIGAQGTEEGDLELAFLAGLVTGRNRVKVADSGDGYVNLGLIPFFRYDVMFDVENGVVGFAPCRNGASRRRLPVIGAR